MKIVLISLATLLITAPVFAETPPTSREVPIAINEAFVPGGFDSSSDAYVVASGIFPNGCYQWNRAKVETLEGEKVINVESYAEVSQGMCLMVLVPFTKEISLGKLSSGDHKVRFLSGDGTYMEKTLSIE